MTTTTLTVYDAILKDYYTKEKMIEQSYAENPLYAMLKKQQAGGRRYIQPIEYANPGGGSAVFTDAMTNNTTSLYTDFIGTRSKQYQRVVVDHEALLSTQNPEEAFQPAFDEFDRGLRSLGEKIAHRLYRTTGGNIGKMTAISTNVATLADKADAFNFQIGQLCTFSDTDGTGSLRDSGDTSAVTAIDYEAGTVTFADTLATKVTGVLTTDYIFPKGDYGVCLPGLEDWLPVTNRSTKLAASFYGVTRSVDTVRLGGLYMDGTTFGGIDEILIKGVARVAKHGGKVTHIFMNPETMSDLQLLANSKVFAMQSFNSMVKAGDMVLNIGFSGMRVVIGGQTVQIFGDRNCPTTRIYMLELPSWKIWHTGDLPGFLGEKFTGNILKMAESEDSLEARIGCYMWLGCSAPSHNLVASCPTAS